VKQYAQQTNFPIADVVIDWTNDKSR